MPDQPMAPIRPMLFRHELHQIELDLLRIFFFGQAKALRQTDHVRVHDDPFVYAECVSQNNIRRFPTDTGQFAQFFHRVRNLTAKFVGDCRRGRADALGLVAEKSGRFDRVLQLSLRRLRVIFRAPIFLEQRRRDHVYAFVGALRGENRRDQQLERILEIQLGVRVWVNFRPNLDQFFHPLARRHE